MSVIPAFIVIGPALIPLANSAPAEGPTVIFSDIVVGLVLIILSLPKWTMLLKKKII